MVRKSYKNTKIMDIFMNPQNSFSLDIRLENFTSNDAIELIKEKVSEITINTLEILYFFKEKDLFDNTVGFCRLKSIPDKIYQLFIPTAYFNCKIHNTENDLIQELFRLTMTTISNVKIIWDLYKKIDMDEFLKTSNQTIFLYPQKINSKSISQTIFKINNFPWNFGSNSHLKKNITCLVIEYSNFLEFEGIEFSNKRYFFKEPNDDIELIEGGVYYFLQKASLISSNGMKINLFFDFISKWEIDVKEHLIPKLLYEHIDNI